jgi:hypothetical protein
MRGNLPMSGLKAIACTLIVCVFAISPGGIAWSQQAALPPQAQARESLPVAPQADNASAPKSYVGTDYSKSVKPFPSVLSPYKAREVPDANLANTPRIDQLMRDG